MQTESEQIVGFEKPEVINNKALIHEFNIFLQWYEVARSNTFQHSLLRQAVGVT